MVTFMSANIFPFIVPWVWWITLSELLQADFFPPFKKKLRYNYLQCCVSYRYTTKLFIYMCMCVYICIITELNLLEAYIQLYIYIYIYIHIYIFFFRFFSLIDYYNILSIVPCAIEQVLVGYIFYIQQCVYVNPNLIYPSPQKYL